MYPDVKATQLSAVQHYCTSGWKEGKDPSPEFSTVFYMDDNPDVKDAAINPLYHYVVAGKTERRYPRRPGGAKADIIFNLNETSSQKSKWKRMLDKSKMISMEGRNSLKALSGKTILSVSHDAYVENVGGIQLCIGVEELHYVKNATNYLHISPYQPSLQLSEFRDNAASGMHLQCILNGKYLGTIKSGELLNILERTKNVSFEPVIHGLHGHSPEYLLRLFKKLGVTSIDVWGHDYFTICESFTLMRNSTTFCNAPDKESKSCSVCLYGSNRQKHIGRVDNLLSQFDCHMIFPSNAAQKIWTKAMRKRLQANIKSMQTIQHIALKALKPQSSTRVRSGSARPLKICYIGYPSYHKGWNDFEELVRYTVGNANVAFFQIGSRPDENSIYPIQFEHCEVQKDNVNAMRDIVARLEIDYLYVPVKWPETFNIVSYEAAAGGAQIITHDIPGNVRDFVQTGRRGIVVKDVFELIKKIQDGQLKAVERRQLYEIAYSNMTGDKTVSK